jgi:hypothetical protein
VSFGRPEATPRRRRRWLAIVSLSVAVAAMAMAASAGAIVVYRSGPDLSYQPLRGQGPNAQQLAGANMTYHGGPVVHSSSEYAIFWAPSGFAFPPGYESAIVEYLQDVAADSGNATNVYSVATQYSDSTGPASYQTSFGAAFADSNPYPRAGARPTAASRSA